MRLTRRAFLGGVAAAGAACTARSSSDPAGEPVPALDFHVHLIGQGDGGTGCRLSPAQRRHPIHPFFMRMLGLSENGRLDQDFVAELVRQLRESTTKRAVLVALDARYDEAGRPDWDRTPLHVPNDYLFRVVADHPDLFVPCPSITLTRRDAVEELDRSAERGARVVKIHPPTQDVNPAEARFRPFYRRAADLGVVLLVHTGSEHSAAIAGDALNDPALLLTPLEEGCTVVAAHSGMGSFLDREPHRDRFMKNLRDLMRRFPRLYGDTAVLASLFRWPSVPRIVADEVLQSRTIYASDWPWTSNALAFWNRLAPGRLLALASERNLFIRNAGIQHALGLGEEAFSRGEAVLGIGTSGTSGTQGTSGSRNGLARVGLLG